MQKELEKARVIYNEISAQIAEIGDKDVHELEAKKEELEENIDFLQGSLETLQNEYRNYLLAMAPIILCQPAIQKTRKKIEESQAKGHYPPHNRTEPSLIMY